MKIQIPDYRVLPGHAVDLATWPTRVRPPYKSKKDYRHRLEAPVQSGSGNCRGCVASWRSEWVRCWDRRAYPASGASLDPLSLSWLWAITLFSSAPIRIARLDMYSHNRTTITPPMAPYVTLYVPI